MEPPRETLTPKDNVLKISTASEKAWRKLRENQDFAASGADWGVVADGVSRSQNPTRASKLAVETVGQFLAEVPWDTKIDDAVGQIKTAFEQAHAKVGEIDGRTTLTAFKVVEDHGGRKYAVIAGVGDSRAYKLTEGQMRQITEDDSVPGRENLITQAVGGTMDDVHTYVIGLDLGDKLILTTDGVHKGIGDEKILEIARSGDADSLVREARRQFEQGVSKVDDDRTALVVQVVRRGDVLEQASEVVRGYEGLTARSGEVDSFDDYYALLEDVFGSEGTVIDSKGEERSMAQIRERIEELRELSRSGVPIEQLIPQLNALTRTAGIRLTVLRLLSEESKKEVR